MADRPAAIVPADEQELAVVGHQDVVVPLEPVAGVEQALENRVISRLVSGGPAGARGGTVGEKGNDLLDGGAGNDILSDAAGTNVLIGSTGADKLTGGTGDDLLIAGATDLDANLADLTGLDDVMAEWTSGNTYANRVAHLSGTPGGLNGTTVLTSATVHDDQGAKDSLTGGKGNDWFLISAPDTVTGAAAGETKTTI